MRYFRANVLLLLEAESEAHALDTVSELLRENSMSVVGDEANTGLITWEHNTVHPSPVVEVQHTRGASDEYDTSIRDLLVVRPKDELLPTTEANVNRLLLELSEAFKRIAKGRGRSR